MTEVEVHSETEDQARNQWAFDVRVFDAGKTHDHHVTLSYQDYDLWSHGRVAPSRVVEAAFEFLLEREPAQSILSRFDCSVIRRYFSEVDERLPTML